MLTREVGESSYGLNFDSFYHLMLQFSHLDLDVDCMAQRSNTKCSRYFSRFPEEKSGTHLSLFWVRLCWQGVSPYSCGDALFFFLSHPRGVNI